MPLTLSAPAPKGGPGKTYTTANLTAALAEQGDRVLGVDLDPQADRSTLTREVSGSSSATSHELLRRVGVPARALDEPTGQSRKPGLTSGLHSRRT